MPLGYFLPSFIAKGGKIETLSKNNCKLTITPIDNSGNKRKFVTIEDAKAWEYDPTDNEIIELLKTIAEDEELTGDQIASIADGLHRVTGHVKNWTSEMEGLAERIEARVQQDKDSTGGANDTGVSGEVRDGDVKKEPPVTGTKEPPVGKKPKKRESKSFRRARLTADKETREKLKGLRKDRNQKVLAYFSLIT